MDTKRLLIRLFEDTKIFLTGCILFALFWIACIDYVRWDILRFVIDVGALMIVYSYVGIVMKSNDKEKFDREKEDWETVLKSHFSIEKKDEGGM